jgi:hypothetical protein
MCDELTWEEQRVYSSFVNGDDVTLDEGLLKKALIKKRLLIVFGDNGRDPWDSDKPSDARNIITRLWSNVRSIWA